MTSLTFDNSTRFSARLAGSVITPPQGLTRDELCPVEQWAFDGLLRALPAEAALAVTGDTGAGKSTVLRVLYREIGDVLLTGADLLDALRGVHPLAIEETFSALLGEALFNNAVVLLDDLDQIGYALANSGNPRNNLLDVVIDRWISYAAQRGKRLIFGGSVPCQVQARVFGWQLQPLREADYAALCRAFVGEAAGQLDIAKIYAFAPTLNAYQLRNTCVWLGQCDRLTTADFLGYLATHHARNNVDLEEVQPVDLHDLKGLDDVLHDLETHVIRPFENAELARELQLRPKRGVLLAGPPGTGKTTVGRALARRLKSKFFLIDGTFVAGTSDFYRKMNRVTDAAKKSADCVLFIDDSDVMFEDGGDQGLYRYLLTMLDGLESRSAGRICVMLTAMNVEKLPAALIRSGRVELWLETRLPDAVARAEIFDACLAPVREALGEVAVERLAARTDGFSGADIKRIVEDGKLLLAADRAEAKPLRPATDYFLAAIAALRAHRNRKQPAGFLPPA